MTIKAKHPVRNQIAALSTTNNYYNYKTDWIKAADAILSHYGWSLDAFNALGDEGRTLCPIVDENSNEVGSIALSWYRMRSNRYEINVYVS